MKLSGLAPNQAHKGRTESGNNRILLGGSGWEGGMSARLEIFTLGGVRIQRAGEPVSGLSTKKAEALLIYLAATRRPQPREVLAELLWDERSQSQSMGNLRGVLTNLRQELGAYLVITRDAAGINPEAEVWLDGAKLEDSLAEMHRQGPLNAATAKSLTTTLELYKGEFLQGFSVFDCRGFEEWATHERERLHHLAIEGLSVLANYDLEQKEYQQGMTYTRRILELDPLNENAHRQMMRFLLASGQRTAALAQYETCQKLLRDELGVEPEAETRELYEQIRSGKSSSKADLSLAPKGTVTYLCSYIEGSAQLLQQLRQEYASILVDYQQILQETFAIWNGHVVDSQGDALLIAFPRASQAVNAAIEARHRLAKHDWPEGVKIPVCMGMHTGETWNTADSYISMEFHRAARIASLGSGGQVLLSKPVYDLVRQELPDGARLRDLGAYMLKDSRYPQEIYQLDIPGLPDEFPPLKSLDNLEEEEHPPLPGKSPYMGLEFFDEDDAEWFFGRQALIDRLVKAACSLRFLAVIGASGSGKSSVVRAGLVPAMKNLSQPHWQVKVITPTSQPLDALAIILTSGSESVTATATLVDDLLENLRSLYLYCHKILLNHKDQRLLLVIDQFEELFTLCRSETERMAFITNLLYAACVPDGKVTTVITLRADFYEHLAHYVGLREMVSGHQIYIGAMNAMELREAIVQPAKRGGWELSPGLVDLILNDLGAGANHQPEPGALPLLSHALLETWKRRRGNLLTLKAYTEAGGVRGAIAKTAESVFYGELDLAQQRIAKDIFIRLTQLGEGTQDTRRRISIHELIPPGPAIDSEQIRAVLLKLADARLIITGETTVEVAHEALIREWPTLREWLASDREGLRLHRHLTEAAQEWDLLDRDPGALYRGTRLNQALEWALSNPLTLNAQEQAFLEVSRQTSEGEQAEREARRQRELETARKLAETEKGRADAERQRAEEQARSAQSLRRRAWLLAGVLVLALLLAVAAIGFWRQSTSAEAVAKLKEREAFSRYLTSAALNNLHLDSQLSAHLALEAIKADPSYEGAENALHQVLPELRLLDSIPITNSVEGFFTSWLARDGELLITATVAGIEVVDRVTHTRLVFAKGENCESIFPTEDGLAVAAYCLKDDQNADGTAYEGQVWETRTGNQLFATPDLGTALKFCSLIPPSPVRSLLLYCLYEDFSFHIWDVSTGKELFIFKGHSSVNDLVGGDLNASPDGKHLVTVGVDGLVILRDMETGDQLLKFTAHPAGVGSADFSPDGTHLATLGLDNTIKIWNLTSLSSAPELEVAIHHDPGDVMGILYNPDGTRLAAGGVDGQVKIWNPLTGELEVTLTGHAGRVWVLSFSQDGSRLYTSSSDQTVKEWDLLPGRELLTLTGLIGSAPFNPDSSRLALRQASGSLSIVDVQTGAVMQSWQAHTDWIEDVAWTPDGKWLATSNGMSWLWNLPRSDNSAKIWDASSGQLMKEIPGEEYGGFSRLAWNQDGNRLVISSYAGGVALILDPDTWEVIITKTLSAENPIISISYRPDGKYVASGLLRDLLVWNSDTGSEVFTYKLNHTPLALAYSSDGQRLAVSYLDGSIDLLQMSDVGAKLERVLLGGDQPVFTIAFSHDGTLLASGDSVGTVRVWDLTTMQLRLELTTFSDPILQIAFSPDSYRLVASDEGGLTYVYVIPQDELVDLVKSRIILPMKDEECWEYLEINTCPEEP